MSEDKGTKGSTSTEEVGDEWSDDQAAFLPAWDFKEQGTFVGSIESKRDVENVMGLGGVERTVPIFTIVHEPDGERYSLWGSGMLARVLPELVGRRVRIEDKGLEPQGDGTSLRIFDVRTSAKR